MNGPDQGHASDQRGATGRLDTYALVDVALPPIPTRSRLYALPLCGVGTAQVESIPSYTARLAQAHGLTIRQLINGEIRPRFGSHAGPTGGQHLAASIFKADARALCGVRGWAAQWVTTLEGLTCRTDLRCATMLSWAGVLSHSDLIRRERAWCPDCYQASLETNETAYDRLLWSLQEVTRCPCHRRPLVTQCPNGRCGKTQPYLATGLRPGYCTHCGAWLGAAAAVPGRSPSGDANVRWQAWVGEVLGELLASAPTLAVFPQRERLIYAARVSAEQVTGGNLCALGRQIGRHEGVLGDLVAGKSPVILNTLLRLCYVGGVSPLQFLTHTPLVLQPRRTPMALQAVFQKKCVRLAEHDDQAYRQALEQALRQPGSRPSMRAMGRRLGCDPHYLYRRFPELCKAIARQYLAFRAAEKAKRLERIAARVRAAVLALHRRGLFPSRHRVAGYLNVDRFWGDTVIEAAWCTAVAALGLPLPDTAMMKA